MVDMMTYIQSLHPTAKYIGGGNLPAYNTYVSLSSLYRHRPFSWCRIFNVNLFPPLTFLTSEKELMDEDLTFLRAFTFKSEENLSEKSFECLRYMFSDLSLQSFKVTRSRAEFLASFKPIAYDCCVNSCLCFVGPRKDDQECHYCNEPRFNDQQKPRKRFTYIPLIPRLIAYFKNLELVKQMQYRHLFKTNLNRMTDVFDSSNYESTIRFAKLK